MKIGIEDIKYMVNESVKRVLKEGWKPIYRSGPDGYEDYDGDVWDGPGSPEEEAEEDRMNKIENWDYNALVLVDESDGAILANYTVENVDTVGDVYDEAVNDAKQKKLENKFGSYSVYGCLDDGYDDDTLMYSTDEE